jgi:thioesterase domain-containing protein
MLVPVQTSGVKPPLFVVHGLVGVMAMGRFLAEALGPEQPLYAIQANGIDGRETKPGSVKDMARSYVEEILAARIMGRLLIAGMCTGAVVAIEVVRELQVRGREVGPMILLDPPTVPPGFIPHNQTINPRNPLVASQLYQRVRGQLSQHATKSYKDLPFAVDDEKQMHLATLSGVNSFVALSTYLPEPFPGATVVILSFERAAGFFHPQMHWAKLLPQKPMAYVLPYAHLQMFRSARNEFARVLKLALEDIMNSVIQDQHATEMAVAPDLIID